MEYTVNIKSTGGLYMHIQTLPSRSNMNEAFTSLYFDVAPILAIPLYQLHEAGVFNPNLEKEEITLYSNK